MTVAMDDDLPDEVVTFGGESSIYHRQDPHAEEPTAVCRQHDGNVFRKQRRLVESHYDPCRVCFPGVREGDR
ncbi:hypothetical protein NDI54_05840 [Haloarcula sp. S1AR25-5A]|uniref:Uncharacterized protein n=1 Tax=Haloarcula terrestris TaxID=2950533 RepID=A0AAE4EVF6_9EURY|nr:hypothetical protein [Haloarcula terrestris]MDS0220875.1 hypothetical protein [Haloarcula terrestris]